MGVILRRDYDELAIDQPENSCDHNHGDAQWDDDQETGQKVATNLGFKPLEDAHLLLSPTTQPRPIFFIHRNHLGLVGC